MKSAKIQVSHQRSPRPSLYRVAIYTVALSYGLSLLYPMRFDIYNNLFHHQKSVPERNDYYIIDNIWSEEESEKLLDLVKAYGTYETVARFQTSITEGVGEAMEFDENGQCPHHLLVPD